MKGYGQKDYQRNDTSKQSNELNHLSLLKPKHFQLYWILKWEKHLVPFYEEQNTNTFQGTIGAKDIVIEIVMEELAICD